MLISLSHAKLETKRIGRGKDSTGTRDYWMKGVMPTAQTKSVVGVTLQGVYDLYILHY